MDMSTRTDGSPRRMPAGAPTPVLTIRPRALLAALWRRRGVVVACALVATLLAASAGLAMPRSFTSSAQILIDPRGLKVLEKDIAPQAREPDLSVSIIESEMRIMASDLVLQRVANRLSLADTSRMPNSAAAGSIPVLGALSSALGTVRESVKAMLGRTDTGMTPEQAALFQVQKAVRISRQPNTYVVDVSATSPDRDLAARIANAVAEEYIGARFDSRAEASRRAVASIDGRLEEMREKVRLADAAVERHKEKAGLVSSSGRLLAESRMGELSTQLQSARAETIRAEARLAEVRQARRAGPAAPASEALQSPTLERLQSSYAAARQRQAALAASLLPSHPQMRQAALEVASVERSIAEELNRITGTAVAALERARQTEKALETQLETMAGDAARDGTALVELRELERIAEANRSIYQSFLLRTRELVEQQQIDPSLAVMLASAEPARAPNGPGLVPLVGAASLAGLGLGAALALRRDQRDPRVQSHLQLEPLFSSASTHRVPVPSPGRLTGSLRPAGSGPDQALYFSAPPESETAAAIDRIVRSLSGIRRRTGALVCLVTSAEAYQGKSTIALNLALAFARSGDRVVLVDADHQSGVATAADGRSSAPGLAEVVGGTATCEECLVERSDPPVALLPTGALAGANLSRESISRLGRTLVAPLSHFDAIVVDASANPRDRLTLALAAHADVCLLVAQEGHASKAALEDGARWLETTMSGELHVVTVALG